MLLILSLPQHSTKLKFEGVLNNLFCCLFQREGLFNLEFSNFKLKSDYFLDELVCS